MLNNNIFINFCKNENMNYFRESFKLRLKVEAEGDYVFKIWQDFSRFNLELGRSESVKQVFKYYSSN